MKLRLGAAVVCAIFAANAPASAAEKGMVTFVVRDTAGNDLDARVNLDSEETQIPLGRAQAIEAGIHDVHWSVPNGGTGVQKLTVIEGQQGRIFLITAPAATPTPAPALALAVAPTPAYAQPSAPSEHRGGAGPWPYVLLAGGATLAVASAVFQLVAINEDSDAQHYFWHSTREDLLPSTQEALARSSDSHFDAAKADQTIAIVCGVLAVTAVSAAITWLVVNRH